MTNKSMKSFVGMGAAALGVILVILTITCFAVLTYISADSEYKLSEKSKAAVDEYYQADAAANVVLAEISTAIKNGNLQDFISKKGYNVTSWGQGVTVAFQTPINENKELQVEAVFSSYNQVRIIKWKTENRLHKEGK